MASIHSVEFSQQTQVTHVFLLRQSNDSEYVYDVGLDQILLSGLLQQGVNQNGAGVIQLDSVSIFFPPGNSKVHTLSVS